MSEQKDISALEAEFNSQPDSMVFLPLGEAYLKAGRLVEAMVVCKKGLKSFPNNLEGQILMSDIYLAQGKAPRARKTLEKLVEEAPEESALLAAMARVSLAEGDEEQAIEFYKKALSHNGGIEEASKFLASKGLDITSIAPAEVPEPPEEEAEEEIPPPPEEESEKISVRNSSSKDMEESTSVVSMADVSREVKRGKLEDDKDLPFEAEDDEPPPPPVEEEEDLTPIAAVRSDEKPPPKPVKKEEAKASQPKVESAARPKPSKPELTPDKREKPKTPRHSIADSYLLAPQLSDEEQKAKAKKALIRNVAILGVIAITILTGLYIYRVRTDKIAAASKGIVESLTASSYLGYLNAHTQAEKLLQTDDGNPFGNAALAFSAATLFTRFGAGEEYKEKAKAIIDKAKDNAALENEALYHAARGMYYIGEGDLTAAEASLNEGLLSKNLNNINLVNTMALLQIKKGDSAAVEGYLKKARTMDSTNVDAMFFEGYYRFQSGKYGEAKNFFDNILKMHVGLKKRLERAKLGGGSGAGSAMGAAEGGGHEGESKPKELPKVYRDALPSEDAYYLPEAQLYRALSLLNMGAEQTPAARKELTEVKTFNPEAIAPSAKTLLMFVEGLTLMGEGKEAEGKTKVEKAFSLDPKNSVFVEFVAEKNLKEKNFHASAKYYETAVKLNPNRAENYLKLSEAYLGMKDYEKAAEAAKNGHKMMTDKVPSLLLLARILYAEKKYDEAEKQAAKVEILNEKNPFAMLIRARIAKHKKDPAKSEELFLEAFKEFRNRRYRLEASNAAVELAQLRLENRQREPAREAADSALKTDKNNPRAHYFMAKLLLGDKNKEGAKFHLEEYLRLNPKGPSAEKVKKVLEKL